MRDAVMSPISYLIGLFNAPPLEELSLSAKLGRIAQIVAVMVSAGIVAAAAGTVAIKLAGQ